MEIKNKQRFEVTLFGQNFTLRSDRDASYVQALASYVTKELENMQKITRAVSTHHVSLLVAMNLADKLFRREEELELATSELKALTKATLEKVETTLNSLPQSENAQA